MSKKQTILTEEVITHLEKNFGWKNLPQHPTVKLFDKLLHDTISVCNEIYKSKVGNPKTEQTNEIHTSLLYLPSHKQQTTCDIQQKDGRINLEFQSNCGKFGTVEPLSGYSLTPRRLLEILQEYDHYSDDEL